MAGGRIMCKQWRNRNDDDTRCGRISKKEETYTAPDGKTYTVKNRILYDEDGWDVGRVPEWWDGDRW